MDINYDGGWLGPVYSLPALGQAYEKKLMISFREAEANGILNAIDPATQKPVWDLARAILGEEWLPGRQEIGDCVSWGMKHAGELRQIIDVAAGQEEKFRPWYAPWIYAISRNQIGGGRIRGDGSVGVWAAEAVSKYGVLFADDEGVPPYSGRIARDWGSPSNASENPDYKQFMPVAKDNPCICVECQSVDEIVKMVRDYRRPITIASNRGFKMTPRNYKGYHVFTPSGYWAHQMCWIEYNDDIKALYRLNSWGPDAHGKPLHGETPGGAWNLLDDIESELEQFRGCECFALVEFAGEPSGPDWRPI